MKLLKKMLLQDNSPPKRKHSYHYLTVFKPITFMKTIKLFFIASILLTISANSQITKGNWMVGGSGSLTSYKSEFTSNRSDEKSLTTGKGLLLTPTIGHFIIDKMAFGLSPNYQYYETENTSGINYGLGLFARYYLLKPEKSINILTQVNYNHSIGDTDSRGNSYTLKAGPSIFFNDSVAFECTIDYISSSINYQNNSNTKSSSVNIGLGLQIHLKKY